MSTIKTFPKPDIIDKHEILGENLFVKISSILSNKSTEDISKITGILLENEEDEIFQLLKEENLLQLKINEVLSHMNNCNQNEIKDDTASVEDLLYDKVKSIDDENCSKITGMILELGKDNVETLLQDKSKLDMAVKKAKAAIDINDKDMIGEEVFQETEKIYPEFADKITGMLLELETGRLRELLEDKQLLKHCIDKAYVAISGTS